MLLPPLPVPPFAWLCVLSRFTSLLEWTLDPQKVGTEPPRTFLTPRGIPSLASRHPIAKSVSGRFLLLVRFSEASRHTNMNRLRTNRIRSFLRVSFAGFCLASFTACTLPVNQQRWVSRPGMLFSDSPVFSYQSKLLGQVESGAASSGGAQAAGCTTCR